MSTAKLLAALRDQIHQNRCFLNVKGIQNVQNHRCSGCFPVRRFRFRRFGFGCRFGSCRFGSSNGFGASNGFDSSNGFGASRFGRRFDGSFDPST